jgi:hypothetical protein
MEFKAEGPVYSASAQNVLYGSPVIVYGVVSSGSSVDFLLLFNHCEIKFAKQLVANHVIEKTIMIGGEYAIAGKEKSEGPLGANFDEMSSTTAGCKVKA